MKKPDSCEQCGGRYCYPNGEMANCPFVAINFCEYVFKNKLNIVIGAPDTDGSVCFLYDEKSPYTSIDKLIKGKWIRIKD